MWSPVISDIKLEIEVALARVSKGCLRLRSAPSLPTKCDISPPFREELQPSRVDFPGYFHYWSFTHYLDMQLPTRPRRSDCPGCFLSAEPRRTFRTISPKTMYNLPNWFYLSKVLDTTSFCWIEPPTNCHGSEDRIYRLEVPTHV